MTSYKSIVVGKYPDAVCEASERDFTLIFEVSRGTKFIACGTTASNAWRNAAIKLKIIDAKGERI